MNKFWVVMTSECVEQRYSTRDDAMKVAAVRLSAGDTEVFIMEATDMISVGPAPVVHRKLEHRIQGGT